MAEITAGAVKALREETGLPMMECKEALKETAGDHAAAIEWLRVRGKKVMGGRGERETSCGRVIAYADFAKGVGSLLEVQCESAPVASNEEFIQLCKDLAVVLATGKPVKSPEELLAQASPSKPGQRLQEVWDDLTNRIREVFRLPRMVRIDKTCGAYTHFNGAFGVLVEVEGGNQALANDVALHVGAMNPLVVAIENLDPADVAKEREILTEQAKNEGKKPDNIIAKMVDGRMKVFYASKVLNEQPFVKDDKQTVGQIAGAGKMKITGFQNWKLGQA
jgi:elongation factor Ts